MSTGHSSAWSGHLSGRVRTGRTLEADGRTSIGDGLWRAQDLLDCALDFADVHNIIVYSDGMENEERRWNTSNGCNSAWDRIQPEDTVIYPIGLGPDAFEPTRCL